MNYQEEKTKNCDLPRINLQSRFNFGGRTNRKSDSASSEVVIHTLEEINKKMGKTILLVTHDPIIASSCDRIIFLKDGKVKEDLKRTGDKEQFYNEIITNWC